MCFVTEFVHYAFPYSQFWLAGFDDLRAPNGANLDKRDRVALYLAQKILGQVDKDDAIPYCLMSRDFDNVILVSTVELEAYL